MSEKEERILKTFGEVIPELSEEAQEGLITFGKGYVEGFRAGKRAMEQNGDTEQKDT